MRERIAVIGAPSSAGAYSPGQEKAPKALRDAKLVQRLKGQGLSCADLGDLPQFRWRTDREMPSAANLEAVIETAAAVQAGVAKAAAGDFTLVLGGDCTVGIGTVAGQLQVAERLGLVYFDLHADLNVPASTDDGALDWMGVAHMLDVTGAIPKLAGLGPRRPMLAAEQIVFFGLEQARLTDFERRAIRERSPAVIGVAEVVADPAGSAERARSALEGNCDRIAVHFDVDVIDFLDAPLSENVDRDGGLRLDEAMTALRGLLDSPRAAALTVTEVNPDHGDPDGADMEALAEGLATALAAPKRA
jgi:arginase